MIDLEKIYLDADASDELMENDTFIGIYNLNYEYFGKKGDVYELKLI